MMTIFHWQPLKFNLKQSELFSHFSCFTSIVTDAVALTQIALLAARDLFRNLNISSVAQAVPLIQHNKFCLVGCSFASPPFFGKVVRKHLEINLWALQSSIFNWCFFHRLCRTSTSHVSIWNKKTDLSIFPLISNWDHLMGIWLFWKETDSFSSLKQFTKMKLYGTVLKQF